MSPNFENPVMSTGLEKVRFYSNPKEGQWQRTFKLPFIVLVTSLCSKSFKLVFSILWTKNFQIYKWGIQEAEEPEARLPTFTGLWNKQGDSRKASTFASLTTLKPLTVWITTNWKILKETGLLHNLTCLLKNLHVSQEATTDWFQTGKGVWQGWISSSCLINLYAEDIMWNARLNESQTGIKIARRNINHLR